MTDYHAMENEVATLLQRKMPSAVVSRVDAKPYVDSEGESSLSITVIVRDYPPSEESARLVEVIDEFRTWLVGYGDERFPYYRLLSEADERELRQSNA